METLRNLFLRDFMGMLEKRFAEDLDEVKSHDHQKAIILQADILLIQEIKGMI